MSKLAVYLGILAPILIGAHLLGLIEDTGSSTILSLVLDPSQLFNLSYFLNLLGGIALLVGGTVVIGLLLQARIDQAALTGFLVTLLLIGWDILAIYNGIKDINPDLALLLISPIFLLYSLTALEWWRGMT